MDIDVGDPIVAALAWGMTALAGQVFSAAKLEKVRALLPMVAVLMAVSGRAIWEVAQGQPVTFDVLLRGLGAAGVAVLAHSQLRELLKAAKPAPEQ